MLSGPADLIQSLSIFGKGLTRCADVYYGNLCKMKVYVLYFIQQIAIYSDNLVSIIMKAVLNVTDILSYAGKWDQHYHRYQEGNQEQENNG